MSMARRVVTLDEKIEKAEAAMIAAKAKYDKALNEMEKLVTKKKQQNDKKILEAYHTGNKSAEEIIAFIMGDKSLEDE